MCVIFLPYYNASMFSQLCSSRIENRDHHWYLGSRPLDLVTYTLSNMGTYLVIYSSFIPITIWVLMEFVKVRQA